MGSTCNLGVFAALCVVMLARSGVWSQSTNSALNVPVGSVSVYLTAAPSWAVAVGDQLNLTCSLSESLSTDVLYLAMLSNSTLTNIVQVLNDDQNSVSVTTSVADHLEVHVDAEFYSVEFVFRSVLFSDAGAYICYVETTYSTIADSNTVVISVHDDSPQPSSSSLASTHSSPTATSSTVQASAQASSSSGSQLTFIIVAVCSGSVALAVAVIVPVLVLRHRSRQKQLKQRLRMLEVSRQQSMRDRPAADSQALSRQLSSEPDVLDKVDCKSLPEKQSTHVYLDAPCVLSKTRIMQNAPLPLKSARSPQCPPVPPCKSPIADVHTTCFSDLANRPPHPQPCTSAQQTATCSESSELKKAAPLQDNHSSNHLPSRRDFPPNYNQVLLSNEAVALFGDFLPVPLSTSSTRVMQTMPSHGSFVPNQLYSTSSPIHRSSKTS